MISPLPIINSEESVTCDKDCDKCDKQQGCIYRELKTLLDILPEYVGV